MSRPLGGHGARATVYVTQVTPRLGANAELASGREEFVVVLSTQDR